MLRIYDWGAWCKYGDKGLCRLRLHNRDIWIQTMKFRLKFREYWEVIF